MRPRIYKVKFRLICSLNTCIFLYQYLFIILAILDLFFMTGHGSDCFRSLSLITFNPYLTNGFSHHYHLGESTFIFRGIRSDF